MSIEETLTLDINDALNSLGQLDDSLQNAASAFRDSLAEAVSSLSTGESNTVTVSADTSQFTSDIDAAVNDVPPLDLQVDESSISAQIDDAAASAQPVITPEVDTGDAQNQLGELGSTLGGLGTGLASLHEGSGLAAEGIGLLATGALALKGTLAEMGPVGIAAGAAVGFLGLQVEQGIHHYVELTDQIRRFEVVSGSSSETASRFVVAFNELGVSSDRVGLGLFRLSRQIEGGKDTLAQFGVEVAHNKDGGVDLSETFLRIADKAHQIQDPVERNTFLFQQFGRAAIQLAPVLALGREEFEKFLTLADKRHEVFSQQDLDRAREFSIEMRGLGESFQALQIKIVQPLIGPLTNIFRGASTALNDVTGAFDFAEKKVGGFGKTLGDAAKTAGFFVAVGAVSLVPVVGDAAAVALLAGGALDQLGSHAKNSAGAMKELAVETEHLKNVLTLSKDDTKLVGEAQGAFADSTDETAKSVLGLEANIGRYSKDQIALALAINTNKAGTTDYNKALQFLDPTLAATAQEQERLLLGLEGADTKFKAAALRADQFGQALSTTLDPFLANAAAGFAAADADDALTASLAKATEAGKGSAQVERDHAKAVLGFVQATEASVVAQLRDSAGTETATQARDDLIGRLRVAQVEHKGEAGAIQTYIDRVNAIPPEKLTDILANTDPARQQVDILKQILDVLEKKVTRFDITADGSQAKNEVDFIDGQRIQDKHFKIIGENFTTAKDISGSFLPKQLGGPFRAFQPLLVGERGPEAIVFDRPGTVIPNNRLGGGGQTNITVNEVANDPQATAFAVAERLGRESIR